MRMIVPILALAALAEPVDAHDFWLQPQRFWITPGAAIPIAIFVGHGVNRAPWGVKSDRVLMLRAIGPRGVVDHLPAVRAQVVADIPAMRFATPGTQIVALRSNHATSELPAVRFNDYLREEGLTPAIAVRERTGRTSMAGREIYSRRAKTLVQVGPPSSNQSHVTRPLGMTLEIVPERSPYAPGTGDEFPVRILYEGRALPGATVKLTNLNADDKRFASRQTDGQGRAVFSVPRVGIWQFNVVWTKPLKGDARADFDTTFSSLSFGYPAGQRPR